MLCEWNEKIQALHDDELTPEIQAVVRAHLPNCAACAKEMLYLQRSAAFLKAASIPNIAPNSIARIHSALHAEKTARINGRNVTRMAGWLTAAAAVIILSCSAALYSMQPASNASSSVVRLDSKIKNESEDILANAVKPGSELATAADSVDPLAWAVWANDSGVDGRE